MKNETGTLIHYNVEKADLLNSNFHEVFKSDNKIELNFERFVSPSNCLEDFEVTDADLVSAFHKLADKLSKTSDNMPAYFWKRAAAPLFHIICLFCYCLILALCEVSFLLNGKLLLSSWYTERAHVIILAIIPLSHLLV